MRAAVVNFAPAALMILPSYHIGPSSIVGAGNGLFVDEPVAHGRIIIAPDEISRVHRMDEILAQPDSEKLLHATARWFEDRYTVSTDWPDECYVNHAFEPTGLWHLGFVFAGADLDVGTEVTVDYRHLLGPGQREIFPDSLTGQPIIGYEWAKSLRLSAAAIASLPG